MAEKIIPDIRHLIVEDDNELHPTDANGLHQVARNLVAEQNAVGDRAQIYFLPAGHQNKPPRSAADVPVHCLSAEGRRFWGHRVQPHANQVGRLLNGVSSATVFHLHGVRQPLLVNITAKLRKRNIPFVVTAHSRYAHVFDPAGKLVNLRTAAYVYLLERPFLEAASCVQALSLDEHEILQKLAPRAKVRLIPNGVFSSKRGGVQAKPAGAPAFTCNGPVFGYFGRLAVEHKGLDALVQGFAVYRKSGGAGTLQIMGTGDAAREALKELGAVHGVACDLQLLSPRFGSDKDEVVKGWHYFVMPSRFDRSPLAALEAALLGRPLVLTRQTGLQFERYAAGIAIENVTPDAVAAALHRAARMSPKQWSEQSAGAHRMVLDTADWTVIAGKLRQYYLPADHSRSTERSNIAGEAVHIGK